MEEFTIFAAGDPKELPKVCRVFADHAVNITTIVTEGTRKDSTIKILTDDVVTAKKALEEAGIPFEAREVLLVRVMNRPGELAKVTKMIADQDINIEAIYRLGDGRYAVRVDQMEYAKQVLKERLL